MSTGAAHAPLTWAGLLRLALVQAALGAVVVLCTSTLNRVMIIELGLPAAVPAAFIALHYLVQGLRPRIGYGADGGGRCTPWIIGGVALLGAGGLLAALGTALLATHRAGGLALAGLGYLAVGLGVGAAGTSNLALLARRIGPTHRALAATITWIMMIAGFGLSAGLAGHFLQPYSPLRLVQVVGAAGGIATLVAWLAIRGVEPLAGPAVPALAARLAPRARFVDALASLLAEPEARAFTQFLFLSMLAFSAQELLIESFAGLVFGYAPGRSAQLASLEHGGVLCGMVAVAVLAARARSHSLRTGMVVGTLASALGMAVLALIGALGLAPWLAAAVFLLGLANGCFAVSALGAMMELATAGGRGREGLRMGVWGAAQALAFALGGLGSGAALDLARRAWREPGFAYGAVFACAAALFAVACWRAATMQQAGRPAASGALLPSQGVAHGGS